MVIGKDRRMAVWPGSTYIYNGENVLWAFTNWCRGRIYQSNPLDEFKLPFDWCQLSDARVVVHRVQLAANRENVNQWSNIFPNLRRDIYLHFTE